MQLPDDRMPEAEVSLRLALWLLGQKGCEPRVRVAIDGACVLIAAHRKQGSEEKEREIFPIEEFLRQGDWRILPSEGKEPKKPWHGTYEHKHNGYRMTIHSEGGPDLQTKRSGKLLRVESKGGPLGRKGSPRARLDCAIGQALTLEDVMEDEERWVAVPFSSEFEKVCNSVKESAAFCRTGIKLALVHRNGKVTVL